MTIAILQLVASGRGIAALPLWAIKNYLDRNYISSRPVTENGLKGKLYAAVCTEMSSKAYINDFVKLIRERALSNYPAYACWADKTLDMNIRTVFTKNIFTTITYQ